jgi:hypothetical protein
MLERKIKLGSATTAYFGLQNRRFEEKTIQREKNAD